MPVHRFRTVEEATAITGTPLDPDNLRRVLEWSAFCSRLRRRSLPPGVSGRRVREEAAPAPRPGPAPDVGT